MIRTKFYDPDYRKIANAPITCEICGKALKNNHYLIAVDKNGNDCMSAIHPNDIFECDPEYLPIGKDCAKRLGMEWVIINE